MASPHVTEAWLDGADGHHFYTRTYPATSDPKAILVFVHGFADHISRYERFHPQCAQRGITLFAYDMRGFGRTALDEEHRSADEAYGKTNRVVELSDLEWWVQYVRREYPDVPIFVMGHSAGGGLAMAFATRPGAPPKPETLALVSGIIAQAPLVSLTYPTPAALRYIGYLLSRVVPTMSFSAHMPEERFSHDPQAVQALAEDPLRMPRGTTRGLIDMLSQGEELLEEGYKRWPKDLPLLMTWGTGDEANCPKSGVAFFNKLDLTDKKLVEYEGAYHDLLHEAGDIPDRVTEEYIAWIESHISTKRTG